MSWVIIPPERATVHGAVVVGVDTPPFTDEVNFEGILKRAFGERLWDEWRATNPVVIIARGVAFDELKSLMSANWGDVPEGTVQTFLRKHCMARDAVCLRYVRDN